MMTIVNPLMWSLSKHLSTKQLAEVFKQDAAATGIMNDNDANGEKCQSYQGDSECCGLLHRTP
jgi:hypothetical protein